VTRLFRFLHLLMLCVVLCMAANPVFSAGTGGGTVSTDAVALLAEPRFQTPPGWQWGHFENADHASIRYGFAKAAEPKAVVVFVTGYTGAAEEFFESITDLLRHGYDVWEMDWRGNGGSQRYLSNHDKVHSLGANHDAGDLYQFVSTIVSNPEGKPVFLIAHSYGGLVSLEFLHEHPDIVQKAVLSSPAYSFPKAPSWMVNGLASSMCALGFGKDYAIDQADYPHLEPKLLAPYLHTHDPERLRVPDAIFQTHPDLRVGGATWGFIAQFTSAVNHLTDSTYLNNIKTPILICSGTSDKISDPAAHARAAKLLPNAELFTVPDGRHELMRESDDLRNAWFKKVFAFLDNDSAPKTED
jgi:lysophospholipase